MQSFLRFWSANFLVQVFSKLISFASNQLLVRSLSPSLFGVWSVRLALISDTIVFWARDGIRKAASRSKNPKRFAILPLIIGFIISPIVVFIALKSAPDVAGFNYALYATVASSLMELSGEIWAVPQLAVMEGGNVAKVTGPAFLIRSVASIVLTKKFHVSDENTVPLMLCFGAANIIFGFCIILGFFYRCGKPDFETPTKEEINAIKPFAFQTILQWLFSQGERMVLIASNTEEQIGVYGFVSDISSLIARLIFAPIEASVFSLCASNKENFPMDTFCIATRLVVTIGLFACAFGPSIAPPVLEIVYSKRWSGDDSKNALTAFCRIMPLMALNGVTEAFANARLSSSALMKYNLLLSCVSVVYFGLIFYFSSIYGTTGAILSNGVNMTLRAIMAITVITKEQGFHMELFPNVINIILFVAISFTAVSLRIRYAFALIFVMAALVLFSERKTISHFIKMLRSKKD